MTFSAKKLKHVKICLLHCKKLFISLERKFSCSWALLLKLHLATFSDWERSFWAFVASHSHNLLSALNTELVFLEAPKKCFLQLSSKMTFSAKKLKHVKICLLHCKKLFISLERIFSCSWALLLKLHLALFLTEKEAFEHLWPRILIICLVALNTELVFLEAPKKCFCAIKL